MEQAKQEASPARDGQTEQSTCRSCKTETTMRFRIKSSLFGFRKRKYWVCTRCGNTQDELDG